MVTDGRAYELPTMIPGVRVNPRRLLDSDSVVAVELRLMQRSLRLLRWKCGLRLPSLAVRLAADSGHATGATRLSNDRAPSHAAVGGLA